MSAQSTNFESLIGAFVAEALRLLDEGDVALQSLLQEANYAAIPVADKLTILHRVFHNIKGTSSLLGVTDLFTLAAEAERYIEYYMSGTFSSHGLQVGIVSRTVQFMRELLSQEKFYENCSQHNPKRQELLKTFRSLNDNAVMNEGTPSLDSTCQFLPTVMTPFKASCGEENESVKIAKILVVDDQETDRRILKEILGAHGYYVLQASASDLALLTIAENLPDLILLDIIMPKINGFELCRKLRSNSNYVDIPVLFITSQGNSDDVIRGFQVGGVDYIKKPYSPCEVLVRVQTHLKLANALKTIRKNNEELDKKLTIRTNDLIQSERQALFAQFIQGIVHNMKNPLTTIKGYLELINIDVDNLLEYENQFLYAGDNKAANAMTTIKSKVNKVYACADRLHLMVDSLMNKTYKDRSKEFEMVDLNNIIREELSFLDANLFFKHDIEKSICLCDNPVIVYAVPSLISQVFQNLVQNALDAMKNVLCPQIIISSELKGVDAIFSITDNGHGISDEIKTKIFDPFFTTKRKNGDVNNEDSGGTGLGLYICLVLTDMHKGKMEVESTPAKGTTVKIYLPQNMK